MASLLNSKANHLNGWKWHNRSHVCLWWKSLWLTAARIRCIRYSLFLPQSRIFIASCKCTDTHTDRLHIRLMQMNILTRSDNKSMWKRTIIMLQKMVHSVIVYALCARFIFFLLPQMKCDGIKCWECCMQSRLCHPIKEQSNVVHLAYWMW